MRYSASFATGFLSLAAAASAGCGGTATNLPPAQPTRGVGLDTVASGLVVPWDLAFAPDGRIFLTERPGRIRVIEHGVLRPEPWAELDVARRSETGLMGIDLAPDFAQSGHVFVVGTFATPDGATENRLYRLTEREGRGVDRHLILDGIPAARYHAGAALAFGPDGMLYLSTGDALRPGRAQEAGSLAGKILRLRPDGGIPADNPVAGSLVYALGVRNPQGLAWHPQTRDLFAAEHGPTGLPREWFRTGRDEMNVILPGENYGWPKVSGVGGGDPYVHPLVVWSPAIAPGAMAFYTGDAFAWHGDAFVAALKGQALVRVVLERAPPERTGWRAVRQEALFRNDLGRIRAVAMGPDGHLYFTTSNRDGRGNPAPGDDHLFRIVPRR